MKGNELGNVYYPGASDHAINKYTRLKIENNKSLIINSFHPHIRSCSGFAIL